MAGCWRCWCGGDVGAAEAVYGFGAVVAEGGSEGIEAPDDGAGDRVAAAAALDGATDQEQPAVEDRARAGAMAVFEFYRSSS